MASPYLTDEQAAALRRLGFVPSVGTTSWVRRRMNSPLYVVRQGDGGWFVRRTEPKDYFSRPSVLDAVHSPTLPMDALLVWCEVEGFL